MNSRLSKAACIMLALQVVACGEHEADEGQAAHARIIEEFARNPKSATRIFRQEWLQGKQGNADKTTSKGGTIAMLAMAGELMTHDVKHYNEYYNYIVSQLDSPDKEIVSTAVGALSGARGKESIDQLFRFVHDPRGLVSRDAITAIDYRLVTAKYDSNLAPEVASIEGKLKPICSRSPQDSQLRGLCSKHRLDP